MRCDITQCDVSCQGCKLGGWLRFIACMELACMELPAWNCMELAYLHGTAWNCMELACMELRAQPC